MEREILESEVNSVTENLWAVLLNLNLTACPSANFDSDAEVLVSSISLSGAWNGEVNIVLSERLAHIIANRMYDGIGRELSSQEFEDALRELANVTGGNLKNVVPEGTELSLPEVRRVSWNSWKLSHSNPLVGERYIHGDEPYAVFIGKF